MDEEMSESLAANVDEKAMKKAMASVIDELVATCHGCKKSEAKVAGDKPKRWARILLRKDRKTASKTYFCEDCIRKMR